MARIKYYYNIETCEFEKSTLTLKSAIRTSFSYLFVGFIVAGAILTIFYYLHVSPEERTLARKNATLLATIEKLGSQITNLENDLQSLHELDSKVYRTILNAEPISEAVWDVGTGGSVESDLGDAEAVSDAKSELQEMENKVKLHRESLNSLMSVYDKKQVEMRHVPAIRPVVATVISGYGMRKHPLLNKILKMHTGLDFQAPIGTPVYATADGKVAFAGVKDNGYGIHIDIDHGFGYVTKYAHLSKISANTGKSVKRGDLIGYTGSSGLSKGPHLHYEILKNGVKINPIDYFYSDLDPDEYLQFKKIASQENESMD